MIIFLAGFTEQAFAYFHLFQLSEAETISPRPVQLKDGHLLQTGSRMARVNAHYICELPNSPAHF